MDCNNCYMRKKCPLLKYPMDIRDEFCARKLLEYPAETFQEAEVVTTSPTGKQILLELANLKQ